MVDVFYAILAFTVTQLANFTVLFRITFGQPLILFYIAHQRFILLKVNLISVGAKWVKESLNSLSFSLQTLAPFFSNLRFMHTVLQPSRNNMSRYFLAEPEFKSLAIRDLLMPAA